MTEKQWLACTDPTRMMAFLRGEASTRKFRLFACARGFDVLPQMSDERSRRALFTAERWRSCVLIGVGPGDPLATFSVAEFTQSGRVKSGSEKWKG